MAVATSLADCEFWLRGCVGTQICLKEALLDILHDPTIGGLPRNKFKLFIELQMFKQSKTGKDLTKKGVLKPHQWKVMCHTCNNTCPSICPKSKRTDSKDLDVTSIIVLIRNLTNIPKPKGGWSQEEPQPGDTSIEACVLVIRFIRNFLMHCSLKSLQTKADFDRLVWKRMEKVLLDLKYKNMALFYTLEKASLDQYTDQKIEALNQRIIALEDRVKDNEDDIKQNETDLNVFMNLATIWKNNLERDSLANHKQIEKIQKVIFNSEKLFKCFEGQLQVLEEKVDIIERENEQREENSRAAMETLKTKVDELEKENEHRDRKVDRIERANEQEAENTRAAIETLKTKVGELGKDTTAAMEHLNKRFDSMLSENEVTNESMKEKSDELKKRMRNRYQKVKVAFAPSNSLKCEDAVDREDIVVDLSLLSDSSTVCQMADVCDMNTINELREKQKNDAENKVHYEDILASSDDYIVISGGPGSGKTTLTETLVYQWASGNLWKDYDFVFVIYLRELARFRNSPDITARGIFSHFYPNFSPENTTKGRTLVIFDGFDELFGKEEMKESLKSFNSYTQAIYDLLDPNDQSLPFTRMVTTRPCGCPILFETVLWQCGNTKVYEVLGFSNENIKRYIKKHFCNQDADHVIQKLQSIEFLFDMMVIPFYCWGICYLVKNDISLEELGQTRTSLYTHLLILFIRNHGLRNHSMKLADVLEDNRFKDVCIGLSMLVGLLKEKNKITFTDDDVNEIGIDIKSIVQNSGIIIEIHYDDLMPITYCFLHYTFHEYLEALYVFKHCCYERCTGDSFDNLEKILPIIAGLYGGVQSNSKSSSIVQKFSQLFEQNERTPKPEGLDLIFQYLCRMNYFLLNSSLIEIIYEYHNPLRLKEVWCRWPLPSQSNPYTIRCLRYFNDYFENGALKIKKLTIETSEREDVMDTVAKKLISCADSVFEIIRYSMRFSIDRNASSWSLTSSFKTDSFEAFMGRIWNFGFKLNFENKQLKVTDDYSTMRQTFLIVDSCDSTQIDQIKEQLQSQKDVIKIERIRTTQTVVTKIVRIRTSKILLIYHKMSERDMHGLLEGFVKELCE